ncbi:MAG: type I-B CRISPR-associated protein Cas5b [Oscillospiraceae bacterium]|nr:type I-B CRISPR-associated protein Cas5b [Oscillospiraceae bacterium]
MKGIKFKLSGRNAFFKKNDVNAYVYYTYGNIHKVALLGIFGGIIGLSGYTEQEKSVYPEFYEKLKDLKIAIIPLNKKGYINKKIQTFNNSVGYASKEEGGNLIVKEQWLEEPAWEIYVLDDGSPVYIKIEDYLLNKKCEYLPYLGKNDHYGNIEDVEKVEFIEVSHLNRIDSLFIKNKFNIFDSKNPFDPIWKYEELLPISISEETNHYIKENFAFTNARVESIKRAVINKCLNDNKNIFMF